VSLITLPTTVEELTPAWLTATLAGQQKAATSVTWRLDHAATPCALHTDPHVGSTYIDADGNPAFIDWQAVCAAPLSMT
jgi:Phosphotransferase enzyme family